VTDSAGDVVGACRSLELVDCSRDAHAISLSWISAVDLTSSTWLLR
jgi:hypothetical protein